jgi:hypothetical protein
MTNVGLFSWEEGKMKWLEKILKKLWIEPEW